MFTRIVEPLALAYHLSMDLHTAMVIFRDAIGLGAIAYVCRLVFQPMIEQRSRERRADQERYQVDDYLRYLEKDANESKRP